MTSTATAPPPDSTHLARPWSRRRRAHVPLLLPLLSSSIIYAFMRSMACFYALHGICFYALYDIGFCAAEILLLCPLYLLLCAMVSASMRFSFRMDLNHYRIFDIMCVVCILCQFFRVTVVMLSV